MSAIEYLITSHVPNSEIRRLALLAGVDRAEIEQTYGAERIDGWAAEYVRRVGVEAAWNETKPHLQWGRNALYDFPVNEEVTTASLRAALRPLAVRGNLFTQQAGQDLQAEPQVALVRRFDDRIFVVVADEGVHDFIPSVAIGVESHVVPHWTLCALSTRPGSWRLEVYGDLHQAHRVATAVATQVGLTFTLPAPHSVRLALTEVNELADELDADVKIRGVIPYQDQTGLRKLEGEAGSATADIRDSPFYTQNMIPVTDEFDFDIVEVPWHDKHYSLRISRYGSFWFRAFTPRELVDAVLERAEAKLGL